MHNIKDVKEMRINEHINKIDDVVRGTNSSQNAIDVADWLIPVASQLINDLQELNFDEGRIKDYANHAQIVGHHCMMSAGTLSNQDSLRIIFEEQGLIMSKEQQVLIQTIESIVKDIEQVFEVTKQEDKANLLETKNMLTNFAKDITSNENTGSIPNLVKAEVEQGIKKLLMHSMNPHVSGSMAETFLAAHRQELQTVQQLMIELKAEHAKEFEMYKEMFGVNKHISELESKSTDVGAIFEDKVSDRIAQICGIFSDTVIATGNDTLGVGMSKKGDTLIQVNNGSTELARISIESKSGQFTLTGKDSISAQLEQSMVNHNSDLSLAVVDAKKAPKKLTKKGYIRLGPNSHIVVVDDSDESFRILDMYIPILRELAIAERQRKTSGKEEIVDSDQVILICERAIIELSRLNSVKKNLRNSIAKGALDSASMIETQQAELLDSFKSIIKEHSKGAKQ